MGVAHRSRQRVDEYLDRLDREFGVRRTVEDRWELSEDEYGAIRERFETGTVGGAGAWVRNDDGQVLLVRREGYDEWQEPSGKHEPGETLAETARREVREETGVDCVLQDVVLAQDVAMVADGEPTLHRLIVVFDARYAGGEIRPREGEIADARWFDERPDHLLYEALEELPLPAANE